jgi:hypothetical protein
MHRQVQRRQLAQLDGPPASADQQRDVGTAPASPDRVGAVGGLADDAELAAHLEERFQRLPKQLMIVRDENRRRRPLISLPRHGSTFSKYPDRLIRRGPETRIRARTSREDGPQ